MSENNILKGWRKWGHRAFIILIILWILVPIYWLGIMSVTPQRYIAGTRTPTMRIVEPTFEAYRNLLFPDLEEIRPEIARPSIMFRRGAINSTIVASVSTFLGLFFGSLAAYALARLTFKGKGVVHIFILGSRLIAAISIAIPLFVIFRRLGWLDTYLPLIAVYSIFNMAWATLIMQNYYRMIPHEMEEAARCDGCSRFSAFWRIVVPTAAPGLVSVAIICFVLSWGEFLYSLLFTMTEQSRTLPVIISMFVGEFAVSYRYIAASILLGILPPVILALIFQRFIISGLTSSAVKG